VPVQEQTFNSNAKGSKEQWGDTELGWVGGEGKVVGDGGIRLNTLDQGLWFGTNLFLMMAENAKRVGRQEKDEGGQDWVMGTRIGQVGSAYHLARRSIKPAA